MIGVNLSHYVKKMIEHSPFSISSLEIFLVSDQPTTCPKCGVRTEILKGFYTSETEEQINICLSPNCRFVFLLVES